MVVLFLPEKLVDLVPLPSNRVEVRHQGNHAYAFLVHNPNLRERNIVPLDLTLAGEFISSRGSLPLCV